MNSLTLNGKCPVCGKGPIKPLAFDYSIFVAKPDQTQRVGGLLAYQCSQQLHIFFVMARDAEEAREAHTA